MGADSASNSSAAESPKRYRLLFGDKAASNILQEINFDNLKCSDKWKQNISNEILAKFIFH